MTYVIHTFDLATKNAPNPVSRRFRFQCECGKYGPWRRDRTSAEEDGMVHQDQEAA